MALTQIEKDTISSIDFRNMTRDDWKRMLSLGGQTPTEEMVDKAHAVYQEQLRIDNILKEFEVEVTSENRLILNRIVPQKQWHVVVRTLNSSVQDYLHYKTDYEYVLDFSKPVYVKEMQPGKSIADHILDAKRMVAAYLEDELM